MLQKLAVDSGGQKGKQSGEKKCLSTLQRRRTKGRLIGRGESGRHRKRHNAVIWGKGRLRRAEAVADDLPNSQEGAPTKGKETIRVRGGWKEAE